MDTLSARLKERSPYNDHGTLIQHLEELVLNLKCKRGPSSLDYTNENVCTKIDYRCKSCKFLVILETVKVIPLIKSYRSDPLLSPMYARNFEVLNNLCDKMNNARERFKFNSEVENFENVLQHQNQVDQQKNFNAIQNFNSFDNMKPVHLKEETYDYQTNYDQFHPTPSIMTDNLNSFSAESAILKNSRKRGRDFLNHDNNNYTSSGENCNVVSTMVSPRSDRNSYVASRSGSRFTCHSMLSSQDQDEFSSVDFKNLGPNLPPSVANPISFNFFIDRSSLINLSLEKLWKAVFTEKRGINLTKCFEDLSCNYNILCRGLNSMASKNSGPKNFQDIQDLYNAPTKRVKIQDISLDENSQECLLYQEHVKKCAIKKIAPVKEIELLITPQNNNFKHFGKSFGKDIIYNNFSLTSSVKLNKEKANQAISKLSKAGLSNPKTPAVTLLETDKVDLEIEDNALDNLPDEFNLLSVFERSVEEKTVENEITKNCLDVFKRSFGNGVRVPQYSMDSIVLKYKSDKTTNTNISQTSTTFHSDNKDTKQSICFSYHAEGLYNSYLSDPFLVSILGTANLKAWSDMNFFLCNSFTEFVRETLYTLKYGKIYTDFETIKGIKKSRPKIYGGQDNDQISVCSNFYQINFFTQLLTNPEGTLAKTIKILDNNIRRSCTLLLFLGNYRSQTQRYQLCNSKCYMSIEQIRSFFITG